MNLYQEKDLSYHSGIRHDVIQLLPKNNDIKVLEIGAGGGDSLCYMKENNLIKEAVGIELFELSGSNQTNPLIDKFHHCNIEDESLPIEEDYFDVIIIADVLEHLINPWSVMDKVIKCLKPNGKILVSLPNIREMNTMIKVFFLGDFKYKEDGILDKTHLRFFCKKNMLDLLNSEHFKTDFYTPSFKYRADRKSRKLMNMITLGLFEQFFTFQYLFQISRIK